MKKMILTLIWPLLLFINFAYKPTETKDHLNVAGPLAFDGVNYNLAWTSHPADNYYMQEYIPTGDNINTYNTMLLLNAIVSPSLTIKDAVTAKISELDVRKKTDAVVNYKVFNNNDETEYVIDFLESQSNSTEDRLDIVEWNAYRYKAFTDSTGTTGVMLLGLSMRAYGGAIRPFLTGLKEARLRNIDSLINLKMPFIAIAKK